MKLTVEPPSTPQVIKRINEYNVGNRLCTMLRERVAFIVSVSIFKLMSNSWASFCVTHIPDFLAVTYLGKCEW